MSDSDTKPIIAAETAKRRTFAIISHPDAGKTTLTEKLLLYAGMIRTAGMVQGRKNRKGVSSDWMQMEQDRGISITASAMQFFYKDSVINVLDTPGHQDFSEDTYRTLTAADSAVMVIDSTNGVQEQTKKLFAVCRMRNVPILTFINKMDLPGRDPFELMAEVEEVLKISAAPLFWPIGSGKSFRGVVRCGTDEVILFEKKGVGGSLKAQATHTKLSELDSNSSIGKSDLEELRYELELLKEAGNPFTREAFLAGTVTPVFFGSAMTNFGVEPFFDCFTDLAPSPAIRPVTTSAGEESSVDPVEEPFSAYVFKIQANMDPNHRDSMAFLRVCSGRFERDVPVWHERTGKEVRLSRTHAMFGGDRSTLDLAYPGDIIGVVNPGLFSIGDTVSCRRGFTYKPMPKFPPEVVATIRPIDVMKRKAFDKGVTQLSSEGAVLVLQKHGNPSTDPLVAAVGKLQFEVLQFRLQKEYGVKTALDMHPYRYGAWLVGDPTTFQTTSSSMLADEASGQTIYLYTYDWEKNHAIERNPDHELLEFVA